jgi:hypothetical protein
MPLSAADEFSVKPGESDRMSRCQACHLISDKIGAQR